MLDSLRLFFCYTSHHWGTRCNMIQFHTNMQAPLICCQLEAAMQLCTATNSIQQDAQQHGRSADQLASWVHINE